MSFDGIFTGAIVNELQNFVGSKINRIHQPGNNQLRIDLYGKIGSGSLMIDLRDSTPYIYLAKKKPENPKEPPHFCMVLRKHLQNGKITSIKQDGSDRIIHFNIETFNELGVLANFGLTIEILGRISNIFLLDDNKKIIDVLKRIGVDSSSRPVYPGLYYEKEESKKISIKDQIFLPENEEGIRLDRWLLNTYEGFGPPLCRELSFRAGIDNTKPIKSLTISEIKALQKVLKDFQSTLLNKNYIPTLIGNFEEFYYMNFKHINPQYKIYSSFSELVEDWVNKKTLDSSYSNMKKKLKNDIDRLYRRTRNRFVNMSNEYKDSLVRDEYIIYGDLLSAHAHKAHTGASELIVQNFFDEEQKEISIPLDPQKTIWQNAQNYYSKYSKKKNREQALAKLLPKVKFEYDFLKQAKQDLKIAENKDELEAIRNVLIEDKLLKTGKRRKKNSKTLKPLQYKSSDGFLIFVGKNSRQNDEITMRDANRDDIFLHARNVPGSHVIIRTGGQIIPKKTILEAAFLAAINSSIGFEPFVTVDYTEKKNVRKQRGAKAGQVLYENFKSLHIDTKNPKTKAKLIK